MAEIITGGGEVENFLSVEAVSRDAHRRIGSIATSIFVLRLCAFAFPGYILSEVFCPSILAQDDTGDSSALILA
jgi:hypothetical protein